MMVAMSAIDSWLQKLTSTFGNINFSSSHIRAGAIIVLIFILVLSLAQLRRHFVNWSLKGVLFGLFFGFLLVLALEGFLIIGGKTALTSILGWKNAPQPLTAALNLGREKLIQVLGIKDEIPTSVAKTALTAKDVVNFFQSLNPAEVARVKKIICQ